MAFGLWNGKFRIFKTPLNSNSRGTMAKIILATMIIHNWLVSLGEYDDVQSVIEP
jgi:hypothetical protein